MAKDLVKPYLFAKILTSIDCLLFGKLVGTDVFGNKYFMLSKKNYWGVNKRICLYKGIPEASKISAEWLHWMHHKTNELPAEITKTKSTLLRLPVVSLSKFRIVSSKTKSYKANFAIIEPKNCKNANAKPFELWDPNSL